jgi:hypothetical protein
MDPAIRTKHLRRVIEAVDTVDFYLMDFSIIPPDCLLREFIGGSKYDQENMRAEQLFLSFPTEPEAPWSKPD